MKRLILSSVLILFSLFSMAQFVENMGQVVDANRGVRPDVQFTYQSNSSKLFFFKDKITYVLYDTYHEETEESKKAFEEGDTKKAENISLRIKQQHIDFNFLNSNPDVEVVFEDKKKYYQNFYLGHCPQGITNVGVYSKVVYKNVYNNIDIIFKSNEQGIKYDIVLNPGADINDIQFQYKGAKNVKFQKDKIIIETAIKDLEENIPLSFIEESGVSIDVYYKDLKNGSFGFETATNIQNKKIVIDPVLTWATYFEQTISPNASYIGQNTHVDASGNFYMQMSTYNSDLPIQNPGGTVYLDPTHDGGGLEIYFAQFDSDRNLIWSTYLGGSSSESNYYDHGLTSSGGSLFIAGTTTSTDFPVMNQGGGAFYQATRTYGNNAWFSKFNITTGAMQHSTYLGYIGQIVIDASSSGKLAIIGKAAASSDAGTLLLQNRAGAYNQAVSGGSNDVFVTEFNASTCVKSWGTFVGGADSDGSMGVTYDNSNNLFLFNRTIGNTVPFVNPGGGAYFDNTGYPGSFDCWFIKFNTSGGMVWSTLYGGAGLEGISYSKITVTTNNHIVATTSTKSTAISTTNPGGGAYFLSTPAYLTNGTGSSPNCGFMMRFNNSGVVQHATYMGHQTVGGAYLKGNIVGPSNSHFYLVSMPTSALIYPVSCSAPDYCASYSSGATSTGFIMELNSSYNSVWESYLYSADRVLGESMTSDVSRSRVYVTGVSENSSTPTVNPGSGAYYDATLTGTTRAYKIFEFSACVAPTTPGIIAGTSPVCSGTSQTYSVTAVSGATSYTWSYSGGGTATSSTNSVTFTPTSGGTLSVTATNACGTSSARTRTITVNATPATPGTISGTSPVCTGISQTYSVSAVSGATSYTWSYSGGGTVTSSTNSVTFTPTSGGTLSVTATNACGTSSARTRTITVNSTPATPGTISGTSPVCAGTSQTYSVSAVSGATSYAWSYSGGGTATSSTNSVTFTPTSGGTLSVTATNACGTSSARTRTIVVNTNSTAPTGITGTSTICSGASTTLTLSGGSAGTGATAQWFTGSCGGTSAGTGNSITVSPTATTTYYVRYSGTCNTTTCASQAVTVNTNSTAPTGITGTTTICTGSSTTLTVSGGSAGTGATAQWFTGSCGGTSAGTGNSITVSPTANTTYYVRFSGTCNTTGCESQLVTVNPMDDASFSYSGSTYCLTGSDPAPTITGLTGGTFSVNNGGSINASTGVLDLDANGVTNYTVTYTTGGTCPNSSTASVNVTSAPTAGFSYAGTPYCSDGTNPVVTFAAGASGGVFSDQGTTGDLTIDAGTGEIDLALSAAGTYTVENNIAAAGGCAAANATTSITITQSDDAGYVYSGTTYCLTGTDPVPSISGTSGGAFTSTPAGLALNGSTGEIDLSASTANTYDVTYTTPNTCFADSVIQIIITSSPTADFSYPNALYCEDNGGTGVATAVLNAGSSAGVFANLTSTGTLVIDGATGEIDLALSAPGTYIIENDIVAAGGCAADNETATITITQQDDPSFSYSSTSFCEGDTDPLAAITGTTGGTFTSIPVGLAINATTGEIDVASSTLDITYTVTYTTNGTCPDSQDASVIINTAPTVPTVGTSVSGGTICIGESLDITASGGGSATSYNVYDAITSGTLLGATAFTVSPTATTNYYVEAINTAGCAPTTGRELVTVTVNALPTIDAGTDETICPGDQVTLTATGTGAYSWSTTETTQSIDVSPTTTTTYTVTLTDANTCVNSDQVDVNVNATGPVLVAVDDDYNVDFETLTNLDVLNNDTVSTTVTTIIIDPINGSTDVQTDGSIDYTGNPTYTGSDAFTYIVCEALCATICDTAVVTITVENNDLEIPGGFSPNNDNINDLFVINGLSAFPNNTLQIFNRWGTAVYIAEPYNNDWDGRSSVSGVLVGGELPVGTYFYILDLGNGIDVFRGSIEVKRD